MKIATMMMAAVMLVFVADDVRAQGMDGIWMGQGAIGQSNMNNVFRNNRQQQKRQRAQQRRAPAPVACSSDSMPVADRRRMEARAAEIYHQRGEAAAVAYAHRQGQAYHRQLQRQGICP